MQRYLGSMEGAVLSGKLAAQAIANCHPVATLNGKDSELAASNAREELTV
jgi:15-cis-phytoene desaturase